MSLGVRISLIGALILLGALVTVPQVAANAPDDGDARDTAETQNDDECIKVTSTDTGRTLTDCPDTDPLLATHPPVLVGPMYAKYDGFTLAVVDERSPGGTVYQVTAIDEERGDSIVSDWSTSKCRRFEGLRQYAWHRFELAARDSSGIETEPIIRWMYYPGPHTENRTPSDDPWLVDRIDDVVAIYNLTGQARAMMSDVPVAVYRNEPGFAGYGGPNYGILLGHASHPWTLSHEFMHAFWEHWDAFPLPCNEMNIFTFRRDLAQFILTFNLYDRLSGPNPWEEWRPYYNSLVADFDYYSGPDGQNGWELLVEVFTEGGHFRTDIWDLLYHVADTDPPMLVSGNVHLIPPPLQRYFAGYIEPVGEPEMTAWGDELALYYALTQVDGRLMDFASRYYYRLSDYSRAYMYDPSEALVSLPEPFRTRVRRADRQALVDFVNTLEDMSCNTQCEEVWNAAPGFWAGYTHENLIRALLYTEEISVDTGIELEESNWKAVRQVLYALSDCGETGVEDARELINSLADISETQRNTLLQVLSAREYDYWYCYVWRDPDGNDEIAIRGPVEDAYTHKDPRYRVDVLPHHPNCGRTALYENPPLDLSKGPCQQ